MERAKVFKLFLTSIHKTITSWNLHSKSPTFRLSDSWGKLSWVGATEIQESLPRHSKIVTEFSDSDYVAVGKYSFKLKYGKILFEENSKQMGEFEASLLEENISLLRGRTVNESQLTKLNEIVDGWITYDLKKTGAHLLEVSKDDKKMTEAINEIGQARNAQLVKERDEAKKAKSTIFDYNFCVSSLNNSPIDLPSPTNLSSLALVPMLQALDNATATASTIQQLLISEDDGGFRGACLRDCLELYQDAADRLEEAVRVFIARKELGTVNVMVTTAMESAVTCEDGFRERDGDGGGGVMTWTSPIGTENYKLFKLGQIALCIINMLSSSVTSLSF
ncbi:Pectinesterase inhibitor domain [Arabidopsis suecica]|uniref:Pectinesterase inhibitor domain n=1 Tax=Arabidopsis suecica TaxID=45249 RepID=A0A8T1YQB6_ARASU|nr:Pectinesterase inhibitor domain [Arabidopsis suecica]